LALTAGLALVSVNVGLDVEERLGDVRANILAKPASGQVYIAEIDAKSLEMVDRWPWPRA